MKKTEYAAIKSVFYLVSHLTFILFYSVAGKVQEAYTQ